MVKQEWQEYMPIYWEKDIIWELLVGTFDPQFLHFCLKGCSLQTKGLGGTSLATDPPSGLLQHGHHMHSLHIMEVLSRVRLQQF